MIVSRRSWGRGGREEGKEKVKEGGSGCSNTNCFLHSCGSLSVLLSVVSCAVFI